MTFSGFDLPDELQMLSDVIADFVRDEIVTAESALDPAVRDLPADVLAGLQAKAKELGFWCLDAPREFGGGGLSAFEMAVIWEQATKHRFSFPHPGAGVFGFSPPVVMYRGSPQQIEEYVRPTIDEGWLSFTAISEPSGGSDPARSIRTTARRSGDTYILNGRKMWATNADHGRYGVVYARTDSAAGRSGISAFVVDAGTPGMSTTSVPVLRNHWTTELTLEDCEIPAANLIGEEGQGFALVQEWLVRGRLAYAAQAVGVATESVRLAIEWAQQRETFGELLAARQGVQFPIADSLVEIEAARLLTWRAAWAHDQGRDARTEASVAKLYGTEMGFRVVDRAIQILGGMGVSKDMPLEHWFRDLRVARIVEGASEIHRYLIAREALGGAALGQRAAAPAVDGVVPRATPA
ncbi:MAG: acyl-CoA dehydrogenase [Conexibacter sp.]|nr:acyl-CoA dehydrogenase [Conexibacter sp.]